MKPAPLNIDKLLTERLILIPFTLQICQNLLDGDFNAVHAMGLKKGISWPDDDVMDTLPRIINNLLLVKGPTGFESWMIVKNDTLEIIGDLGFKGIKHDDGTIDIGYGIIKEERRKGYAAEAVAALVDWAFSQTIVNQITARCAIDNSGSINLLKKLNFNETSRDSEMAYWSLTRC